MAHLHTSGKQNWIYAYINYNGKKLHKKTPYTCKVASGPVSACICDGCKDARSWVGEIERKIRHNTFVYSEYFDDDTHSTDITNDLENKKFKDYAYEFLDYHCNVIEDSTSDNYTSMVNQLCLDFGNMKLKDIKPVHVRAYISKYYDQSKSNKKSSGKTNSLKTIKNKFWMLKMIMQAAVIDEIISSNPCDAVKPPKGQATPVDPFELDEVKQILAWLKEHKPHMVAFYAIGFFAGMRTGEIMGLQWDDIDFNDHTIIVQRSVSKGHEIKTRTKTADYRIIDIIPALDEYLEWHKQYKIDSSDFLFNTNEGNYFRKSDNLLKSYWKPCLEALGMKYRIQYNTRHTFACLMIDSGENLNWIKNMLGHTSLEMLMRVYGNKVHRINKTNKRRGLKFQYTLKEENEEPSNDSGDFEV
jgi:integrase